MIRRKLKQRDNINGITKPAICRLARRGGVKRISGLVYDETRGALKKFLENVLRDSVTLVMHNRRKVVKVTDVVYALKKQGRTIYGFDKCSISYPPRPPPGPLSETSTNKNNATNGLAPYENDYNLYVALKPRSVGNPSYMRYISRTVPFLSTRNTEIFELTHTFPKSEIKTILKVMQDPRNLIGEWPPDNLVNEYIIGKKVNKFTRTPNVLQTLKLYKLNSNEAYEIARNSHTFSSQNVMSVSDNINIEQLIINSCYNPTLYLLLQLYIPHTTTLNSMLHNAEFVDSYLFSTLFQIYAFLRIYQNVFTHNDLHSSNVVLLSIPGKYFNFIYTNENGTNVNFMSPYLVKIIDYSRSYHTGISPNIHDILCKKVPNCGIDKGYVLDRKSNDKEHRYLFGHNVSMDLKLLHGIDRAKLQHITNSKKWQSFILDLVYNDGKEYVGPNDEDEIYNVEDAYQKLFDIMSRSTTNNIPLNSQLFGIYLIDCSIIKDYTEIEDEQQNNNTKCKFELKI